MNIFGWDLPPGVTDQMIDDLMQEHDPKCPAYECDNCECECLEIREDAKADAAEARMDRMEDR